MGDPRQRAARTRLRTSVQLSRCPRAKAAGGTAYPREVMERGPEGPEDDGPEDNVLCRANSPTRLRQGLPRGGFSDSWGRRRDASTVLVRGPRTLLIPRSLALPDRQAARSEAGARANAARGSGRSRRSRRSSVRGAEAALERPSRAHGRRPAGPSSSSAPGRPPSLHSAFSDTHVQHRLNGDPRWPPACRSSSRFAFTHPENYNLTSACSC